MTFKEIRALSGLKRTEFSRKYGIPPRTLENWETEGSNHREPAEWILNLLERVVKEDMEAKEMRKTAEDFYITAESFGADCPENWEDIADQMNAEIDELEESGVDLEEYFHEHDFWDEWWNKNRDKVHIRRTTWSVELEATGFTDDTFNGTYDECIQYCEENDYKLGRDARLVEILTEDGIVIECLNIEYDIDTEVEIGGYEITRGTAIADGDTERQKALFVHRIDDEFGDGDMVVFDCDMPEDEDDLRNILEDTSYQTTYDEEMRTFKKC